MSFSILASLGIFAILEMDNGNTKLSHKQTILYYIFSRLLPKHIHTNLVSWDFCPNLAICPFQPSLKKLVLCLLVWARQNLWDSQGVSPGCKLGSALYSAHLNELKWTCISGMSWDPFVSNDRHKWTVFCWQVHSLKTWISEGHAWLMWQAWLL